jgi:CSLREA domain-containing protein
MPAGTRIAATVCVLALLLAVPVSAVTFVVTTTDDTNDGACNATRCTLRDAVIAANAAGGGTITLPAGQYALTHTGVNEQAAATGDLDVTNDLTINGAGAQTTTIDGNAADRVFEVIGVHTLTLNGVTVTNGSTTTSTVKNGGGILADSGTVVLNASVVTENVTGTPFGGGGGIEAGTLTMTNSTVSGNVATGQGGGINIGNVTMTGSTVSGNQTTDQGAGIFGGNVNMTNSTVSGNSTSDQGGGIFAGNVTMTNSTVSGNTSSNDQGGGLFLNGTTNIMNSSITGNTGNDEGGGIFVEGGFSNQIVNITDSTISNNTNTGFGGGGIFILPSATVTLTRCTITGNTTNGSGGGGGIENDGATLIVVNSTIVGNTVTGGSQGGGGILNNGGTATITSTTIDSNSSPPLPPDLRSGADSLLQTDSGANLHNASGTLTITNTIVANPVSSDNCLGTIGNGGGNLQFPGTTCGAIPSADPLLQGLASNGGPTQTQALTLGSPAINAATGCPPPATDQRGITRPQGAACEIGAFECQTSECQGVVPTGTVTPTAIATGTPTVVPPTATRTSTPIPGGNVIVPTLSPPMLALLVLALAGAALFLMKRSA